MTSDSISSDLRDLAARSAEQLPTHAATARALDDALAARVRRGPRGLRRPVLAAIGGLAISAAVMLVPVPYAHQVGWSVPLRGADGRVATVSIHARNAADARRVATALGAARRAAVTVAARTELVWGSVYAMAREKLLRVNVNMRGKSDAEVAEEIRAQLADQGWTAGNVDVQRSAGESTVSIAADDGAGAHLEIVRRADGEAGDRAQLEVEPIDDAREPGMTDDELRAKIVRQLAARGLDAEVTVNGGDVQVRAFKKGEARP